MIGEATSGEVLMRALGWRCALPLLLIFAGLLLLLGGPVRPAYADPEVAAADIEMTPVKGSLYREAPRPVNWRVESEITAPWPEPPLILPLKRMRVAFPEEMSFNPDPGMAVCPDSKVGPPPVNMSVTPEAILARCPKSVLGNGTSELYLARLNAATGPQTKDGVLIIFNGGRNRDGSPRLKVYGYSEILNTGIYIEGNLRRNVLVVDIPYLTADSSVGSFNLNIPGSDSPFPARRGRDPKFVRATCADGTWDGLASFTLGTRDPSGNPLSPDSVVDAPPVRKPCSGAKGRPRLTIAKAAKKGITRARRSPYVATVRNTGTATSGDAWLRVRGRGLSGTTRVAPVRPGAAKRVRIIVRSKSLSAGRKPARPTFRLGQTKP